MQFIQLQLEICAILSAKSIEISFETVCSKKRSVRQLVLLKEIHRGKLAKD